MVFSDSMAAILALTKGRSSQPGMLRVTRQWCALVLAFNLDPRLRWVPSERNPADAPSRRFIPPGVRGFWEADGRWSGGIGSFLPPAAAPEAGLAAVAGGDGARPR